MFLRSLVPCLLAPFLAGCAGGEDLVAEDPPPSIYWSDGDSGQLGGVPFRLANVHAPETGGVGAAIGGADCETERALGYESKAFMVERTRTSALVITRDYGPDRLGRQVVDLPADGIDLSRAGLEAGYLRPWPHDGKTALSDKPDWCGGVASGRGGE
mgnify:FL=1